MSERAEQLGAGDVITALPETRGSRVTYHAVYMPRQEVLGGQHAVAIVCQDDHPTMEAAIDCGRAIGTLFPLRLQLLVGGRES